MSKGVAIAIVVGGVVLVGGAAIAMAATGTKPVIRPNLGPPPPPPPSDSLGARLVEGLYDEANKIGPVRTYTGGENAKSYIVKNVATGGLYGTVKGGINYAKAAWNSLF